jgi:hypothetical protein
MRLVIYLSSFITPTLLLILFLCKPLALGHNQIPMGLHPICTVRTATFRLKRVVAQSLVQEFNLVDLDATEAFWG